MKTVIFAKCFVNVAEKNASSIITQSFCLIAKLPGTHTHTNTHRELRFDIAFKLEIQK